MKCWIQTFFAFLGVALSDICEHIAGQEIKGRIYVVCLVVMSVVVQWQHDDPLLLLSSSEQYFLLTSPSQENIISNTHNQTIYLFLVKNSNSRKPNNSSLSLSFFSKIILDEGYNLFATRGFPALFLVDIELINPKVILTNPGYLFHWQMEKYVSCSN